MKKNIIVLLFSLFISLISFAQYVVHRERGNVNQDNIETTLDKYDSWTDISTLATHFKSCQVKMENECLAFRVQTTNKEYSFLEDDPRQVKHLLWYITNKAMTADGKYCIDTFLLDVVPRLGDEFVTAILEMPSGQTEENQRGTVENGTQQADDVLENLQIEVQSQENSSSDDAETTVQEDPFQTYYDKPSLSNSGQQQLSANGNQLQEGYFLEDKTELFESWLEYIVVILFVLLIIKGLFKALFSSSKKSNNDKNYEDGPAWFHDHGKDI